MQSETVFATLAFLVWAIGCGDGHQRENAKVAERKAQLAEIAQLRGRLARAPEERQTLMTLASRQFAAGEFDDAQVSFERALRMSSDSATALEFAELLYRRGRYLQAVTVAREGNVIPTKSSWLADLMHLVDVSGRHGTSAPKPETDRQDDPRVNSLGMHLLPVGGGRFNRGDASGDANEQPVRPIVVSPLRIGQHEVTVGQFALFVKQTGYQRLLQASNTSDRDSHPIFGIAWVDAQAFTIWLSARERAVYRLPTEAEWEFTARGPQAGLQPWGHEIGQPQIDGNWGRTKASDLQATTPPTRPVGSFPRDRSPLGLFDIAGNVQEWCLDEYDATYYAWSPERDPFGPITGTEVKVLRGGAWNHPGSARFAVMRARAAANQAYTGYGFRVVLETQSTRE